MRSPLTAVGLVCVALAGCSGTLRPDLDVKISAESTAEDQNAKSFTLAIADADRPYARRVANIIRAALEKRGWTQSNARADIEIRIDYSIGAPTVIREIVSTPIFRTLPGTPTSVQRQVGETKDGKPIYSTVSIPGTPTQQYVGEQLSCQPSSFREKKLRVAAYAAEQPKAFDQWSVTVRVWDVGHDTAMYAPLLAAAAANYLQESLRDEIDVTVSGNGRKVSPAKHPRVTPDTLAEIDPAAEKRPGDRC